MNNWQCPIFLVVTYGGWGQALLARMLLTSSSAQERTIRPDVRGAAVEKPGSEAELWGQEPSALLCTPWETRSLVRIVHFYDVCLYV